MANQMIALQARAPQLPNLAGAAAQYGNMMANMAAMKEKQASIQRADAFRQLVSDPGFDPANPEHIKAAQSLDPVGAEKIVSAADARRKANLEYLGQLTEHYRNELANVDPNDKVTYGALREEIVKAIPGWGSRLPTIEQWNADTRLRTLFQADKVIEKTVATPVASFQVSDKGVPQSVTVGGLQPSIKEVPQFRYEEEPQPTANTAPTPPKLRQPTPVAPEALDAAATAIAEGKYMDDPRLKGLPPEALDDAQKRAMRLRLDTMPPVEGSMQPMSARRGQPDLAQVVNDMMATGFVTQSNLEAMRQVAGPDKDAQLAEILRSNNIQILPDEGADQFRSAVYRPEEGAGMQEVGYVPTTTRFKSPMQAPMPGSAIVPPKRIKEEKVAETSGTEETKFDVELRKSLPKAKGALNLAVKGLDRDLSDIDYVLTSPAREMIVGSIEGRLHPIFNVFRGEAGQQAQNVQSRLDKIKASSIVKHLQEMRDASPQGSSLFGQVTEYEDRLVAALAGLDQAQDERTFDNALRQYRSVIVEMRQNLPAVFNDTYGKVGAKETVSAPTPAPGEAPRKTDVDYLMKNRNNPRVVGAFRQHFGEQNLQRALRGR